MRTTPLVGHTRSPANEYMRPPEQHLGASVNDYPAISLHLANLQQGQQAMNDTLRRHEQ